jgi:predicted small secreted protein
MRWLLARVLAAAVLVAVGIGVVACNTAAGFGKDVSAAGHAMSNAAEKVKDKL